jgi:hypothetical protein
MNQRTTILRVIARHPHEGEHVIYALAIWDVDVSLLHARGFDLTVDPIEVEDEDQRLRDAETVSFFALVHHGWRAGTP